MTLATPEATDPIRGPLQDLRRAVEALRPHLLAMDQLADLSLIEAAVSRLSYDGRLISENAVTAVLGMRF